MKQINCGCPDFLLLLGLVPAAGGRGCVPYSWPAQSLHVGRANQEVNSMVFNILRFSSELNCGK